MKVKKREIEKSKRFLGKEKFKRKNWKQLEKKEKIQK